MELAAQLRLLLSNGVATLWQQSDMSVLRQLAARSGCCLSSLVSWHTSYGGTRLSCCAAATVTHFTGCAVCVLYLPARIDIL
jgi:hypothetical protein